METSRMDARNSLILQPDATEYPAILRRCEVNGRPPVVTTRGNPGLLDEKLLGFFCSMRCPGDIILKIYDLARVLRSTDVTLIGGFQSAMEKEFLDLILRGSARVIFCPARGLGTMRIPANWRKPLADGRLLLLSFFDNNMCRPVIAVSTRRNTNVVSLADCLLIAHAEKGSKTEKLCKDTLGQGKPVFALASPDNMHILELGAVPITADNSIAFLTAEL